MAFEIPKRLPLIVQSGNRDDTMAKDAKLVNCIAEKDPNSEGHWISKRMGLSAPVYTLLDGGFHSGLGAGMYLWNILGSVVDTVLVVVSGNTPYYIKTVAGLPVTTIIPNAFATPLTNDKFRFFPIPIVQVGVNDFPGLVMKNYVQTFILDYNTAGRLVTVFAKLTAGVNNFPSNTVNGFVNMNGFNYVMDTSGVIWGSVFQDVINWDPLNKIFAQIDTDGGVCLARQLTYIVAFKQRTTEFFVDDGNPGGSPLSPVEGAVLRFGCADSGSVQELDDSLYWVATNQSGLFQVARLQNLQFSVVSTPQIDRLIEATIASIPSGAVGEYVSFTFHHDGHSFYVLRIVLTTFVYDVGQNLWYYWTDKDKDYWDIVDHTTDLDGLKILQSGTGGFIYNVGGAYTYPTDNGTIVPADIYTPNFDAGIDRRKMLSMMQVDADQVTGSKLALRVSDDDYQSWSNFRYFDLGDKRPTIIDCGTFYKRAFHFRHESATGFRIKAVNLQMAIGTL